MIVGTIMILRGGRPAGKNCLAHNTDLACASATREDLSPMLFIAKTATKVAAFFGIECVLSSNRKVIFLSNRVIIIVMS